MKTLDFFTSVSSTKLKESFEKQFGSKVNLDTYSREQLEDMRNKIRTKVFQQEGTAGFNELLTNEAYQKNQALLQLLNTRIKEMLGENIAKLRDKMDELNEAKKGVRDIKHVKKAKGSKPDFLDMDKDGDKKEPMKKAVADKKKNPFVKKESVVSEISDKTKFSYADKAQVSARGNRSMADLSREAGDEEGAKKYDAKAKKRDAGRAKVIAPLKKHFGMKEGAKPDFLDMDDDGDEKEPMKKAVKDKKANEGFPTVADAKARHEKEKTTGKFDKKSTSTGTVYTKKHTKADAEHTPEKKVKEGFPTVADAKARHEKEKTTGKFDKKSTSTGTVYTKKHTKADAEHTPEKKKAMSESNINFKHNVRFVNESIGYLLQEDEEGKAKAITAASDMVNDFTGWMQRVGQYQTKAIIELADAIKADFGAEEAEAFKQSVAPALAATLETLTAQREAISQAVAVLAGEAAPADPMGMEPGMDDMGGDMGGMGGDELPPEPGMELSGPDEMNPATDEFGAADAAAGAGTTGREMRESKFARKLAESHSIMAKLSK